MDNNNLFHQNLQVIKAYDEFLYEAVKAYDSESMDHSMAEIENATDGSEIIKYTKNDYEWYFNSRYEPKRVVEQWINNLGKIESIATITMFGLGNGMILEELLKRTPSGVIVMIYEPSIDIFMKMMTRIDLSLLGKRVFILVKDINDVFLESIVEALVTYENLSVCKFLGHPNYWTCFPNEAKTYIERLQTVIKHVEVNNNTKLRLSERYYKNILMNMKFLKHVSVIDQLICKVGVEIPVDLPVIIVSAGPSLKNNIKELKKVRGKAFLIATDSALNGMLLEGIVPDVFVTLDAIKSLQRFENEELRSIPLICTESSRWEVLDKHTGKKIFINNAFGFGNLFLNEMGVSYQASNHGASVATFAYTIAMMMGFKTIILVGQDLAFTDNSRYYEKAKVEGCADTLDENKSIIVEDIHGGKVKTSRDLLIYKEWFEKQIKECPEMEIIDATEGGAKICGSIIRTLSDTIEDKCRIEFDMRNYLNKLPECLGELEQEQFDLFLDKIMEQYNQLYQDTKRGKGLYERLMTILQNESSNNSEMMKITKEIGEVTQEIESNIVYFHIQHKLERLEYTVLNNLGVSLEDEMEDALQMTNRGKLILEALEKELKEGVLEEVERAVLASKSFE